jgi:L,D-transpeptidase ErfK/SrfK
MRKTLMFLTMLILVAGSVLPATASGPYSYRFPSTPSGVDPNAVTVVGAIQHHVIRKGEDLLGIARQYGLGYNAIGAMHRDWDPFILPAGTDIVIPTLWILPYPHGHQIIVNTGAMRLYYFPSGDKVYTFPIGMGVLDFKTPAGNFKVVGKKVNPTWHIPKSLQAKYGMAEMPPGPENPLGEYKLTLSWGDYGIHGTAMPWGVGRLVSHGCTRMYPEHIKQLFPLVPVGTSVEYIYEPALVGFRNGRIFLSVHEDYYFKIRSMILHVLNLLESRGVASQVNMEKVMQTVEEHTGMPIDISRGGQAGGQISLR